MGQKENIPCQISADMIRAVTLWTKVLGCLFSTRWQGNIFVHSIMPKVQETQGADGGEKEGGGKKKSLALKEPISGIADLTTCIWTSAQTMDYTSVTAYWVPFPSIHIPPWSKMLPRNEHFSVFLPLVKKMPTFNILDKMNSSRFPNSSCAKWDSACVCWGGWNYSH